MQLPNIINSSEMPTFTWQTTLLRHDRSFHHPCPVTLSVPDAHINRKHSLVLTVEEGLYIHLSGYKRSTLPTMFRPPQKQMDKPRNRIQMTPISYDCAAVD